MLIHTHTELDILKTEISFLALITHINTLLETATPLQSGQIYLGSSNVNSTDE
uniref:Uncharacterized protein n=1 Tax=Arion vulgaris TaxID=1028688 RepID=A0A0B6ZKK8_9EUPU